MPALEAPNPATGRIRPAELHSRWIERNALQSDTVDIQVGDEAGIKSATLRISGDYAYGYLKNEIGVHRLVRISPSD